MKKRSIIILNLILILFACFSQWILIYQNLLKELTAKGFVIRDYKFWWFSLAIPGKAGGFTYGFFCLDLTAIILTLLVMINIVLIVREKE